MNSPVFKLTPTPNGWTWKTFDAQGRTVETGLAGSRAEAAAFIIRGVIRAELLRLASTGELNTDLAA